MRLCSVDLTLLNGEWEGAFRISASMRPGGYRIAGGGAVMDGQAYGPKGRPCLPSRGLRDGDDGPHLLELFFDTPPHPRTRLHETIINGTLHRIQRRADLRQRRLIDRELI